MSAIARFRQSGLRSLPYIDYNRFGETVLSTHSVAIPKELGKAQTTLQHRGAVSERPFDRLPPRRSPVSDSALVRTNHFPGVWPLPK